MYISLSGASYMCDRNIHHVGKPRVDIVMSILDYIIDILVTRNSPTRNMPKGKLPTKKKIQKR